MIPQVASELEGGSHLSAFEVDHEDFEENNPFGIFLCVEEAYGALSEEAPGIYRILVPWSFGVIRGCISRWDRKLEKAGVRTSICRMEDPSVFVRVEKVR